MGIFTAKDVIDRVSYLLKDTDNVRWLRSELLAYVNEGQSVIVKLQPEANQVRTTIRLVEGTRQPLPEEARLLLTIVANIDEQGNRGQPVRLTTRSILDSIAAWYNGKEKTVVENYIYDDRNPTEFEVYPANDGFGKLEVVYSVLPRPQTEEDPLTIGDDYYTALIYYTIYKATLLDSDFNGTGQLCMIYYQQFVTELSGQEKADSQKGPLPVLQKGAVSANGGTE